MDSCEFKEKLNTAFKYHQQGNFSEAEIIYNELLEQEPDNANVLNLLGLIFHQYKQYDKAVEYIKRAAIIAPSDYFYFNLGNMYLCKKEINDAIESFKKAVEIKPDNADAHLSLGDAYREKHENDNAVGCYRQVIKYDKTNYMAYLALGTLLLEMEQVEEASETIEEVLRIKPDEAEILLNLGLYYEKENMYDKAFEIYNKILQLKPDSYKAYLNLSNVYYERNDYNKAAECCKQALSINPDYADAYLNLGNAYKGRKDTRKALECYEKAMSIQPDHADANFNFSTTCLLNEIYDAGWIKYEWRFLKKEINYPVLPEFTQPLWDGRSIEGKTIYVCYEQGFGDVLQFSRYIPVLASMGANVIFKCPITQERLFKQSNLNAEIIGSNFPDYLLKFDTYTYLMSIPLLLGTNTKNIPLSEGYLKAEKSLVEQYREKYFNNDSFKIGICWTSSVKGVKKRKIPLEYFYKFAGIKNVKLYSLQVGYTVQELEKVPQEIEIVDLGNTFNDFADTAAAVENLDLVISTDTSVVHLTGALGKPVWGLITYIPCWRWLQDRDDSPWYKSMRLFRQKYPGNWEEVMQRVYITLLKNLS